MSERRYLVYKDSYWGWGIVPAMPRESVQFARWCNPGWSWRKAFDEAVRLATPKEPEVGTLWLNGGKPDLFVYVGDDKFYAHRYGRLISAVDFYKYPDDWAEAK